MEFFAIGAGTFFAAFAIIAGFFVGYCVGRYTKVDLPALIREEFGK